MRFEDFAAAHGLLIRSVDYGKWIRCPTEDHPHKKNGAFCHFGDHAIVQNWATMSEAVVWHPESDHEIKVDRAWIEKRRQSAERELREGRKRAAQMARAIMARSRDEQHAYLDGKGFPEMRALVYRPSEDTNLLVVPMRVGDELVGVQLIGRDGDKNSLYGQATKGAEYVIGSTGINVWCEGLATGLSIAACLTALKRPGRVHVCFSAGNLSNCAKTGFVVADNDASGTGEAAARQTGLPYYMPEVVGEDFNDLHRRVGLFKASQILRSALEKARANK